MGTICQECYLEEHGEAWIHDQDDCPSPCKKHIELRIERASEKAYWKFVKRGGPYGPSSTYYHGFCDGIKWARDVDKNGSK